MIRAKHPPTYPSQSHSAFTTLPMTTSRDCPIKQYTLPPRGPLASTTQGYFSIFLTIHHQKPFLILDFYTLAHSLGITLLISVSKTYSERQSRNPQKCHYYVRPKSKEMGLRLSPGCRNAALSSGASGSTLLGREDVEGGKNTGFVPQVYA